MFPFLGSQLSSSIYHSLSPSFSFSSLFSLSPPSIAFFHTFFLFHISNCIALSRYLSYQLSFSVYYFPSVPLNFLPAFCIVQYYILYHIFVSPSIIFSQLSLFFTLSIFLSFNVLSQSLLLSLFRPFFLSFSPERSFIFPQ